MATLYFKVSSDWQEVVKLRQECEKLEVQLKKMDSRTAPAATKTLETQLASTKQQMMGLVTEAAKAGAEIENGFKKKIYDTSQTVNGLSEKIIAQRAVIKDIEFEVKRLGDAYRAVLKSNPIGASSRLAEYNAARKALDEEKATLFGLTQQQAEARLSVKRLRDEYSLYKQEAGETIETNNGLSVSWQKMLGVIGGATALKALASQIVRVRGEFQSMQTAIETMVGKDVASGLMAQLKEMAKISPLTLTDMVNAEKMMLGFNIQAEDTVRYLQALSDISMGDANKFKSLTLAFSQMSAAGKLMGQDLNQMINAGFNPLQLIAEKTGKSISTLKDEMSKGAVSAEMVQQAFIDATSAGGKFYKMSENASKTINGQLSMMQDALDNAFNEIGQVSEGAIMEGIQLTTTLIQNYETVGKVLVGLVATYGAYRTAVMLATIATSKHTIAEIALTNARVIARKAQMLLNAAMLTNPYVAVATVITGLVATMWAFRDSSTEAEKAQARFNQRQQEAQRIEEEHKQRIEALVNSSRDIALADVQRGRSLAELRREYPKIFEQYDIESIKLADILKLKQQIAEEDARRAEAQKSQEVGNLDSQIAYYEKLLKSMSGQQGVDGYVKKLKELRADRDVLLRERGKSISEQFVANLKDIDISEFDRYIGELEKRIKGKGENGTIKLRLPIDVKGSLSDEALYSVKDIKTLIDTAKSTKQARIDSGKTTYAEDYEQARKDWEEAKKELQKIEADKDKFTSQQYEKAKKRAESAEKAYKKLGGLTGAALSKQVKEDNSIQTQQSRIDELLSKQAQDRIKQEADIENRVAQARIDAMADGYEKQEAQRKLDNEKELQSIERQKQEYIQKAVQAQKDIFDAQEELKAKQDKNYKKKAFDPSSVSVDTSMFDDLRRFTQKRQADDELEAQEDAWNEYLIKFGDYQQKRQAITEKYNKQIENAQTAGEAAILHKEQQNALDELDNAVRGSTTLMGQLFADASQRSVNEIQKIIDKAELLMDYLGATKDGQGNASVNGEQVSRKQILDLGISENSLQNLEVSTDEVEALRKAIEQLRGELGSRSPFKLMEEQVGKAVKKIKKGGQDNIAQGITDIGEAISSFAPSMSQFGQDLGKIFGSDDLGNKIAGISEAMGGLGKTTAGVGQIMSGDIVGGVMGAVSGISSVVSAFEGLFGADYSEYENMKARYDTLIDVWDTLIGKKMEYIDIDYGVEAQKAADEAAKLVEMQISRQRQLLKQLASSGRSAGSHSLGVRIYDRLDNTDWERISDLVGEKIDHEYQLWDLSSEQIEKILTDEKLVSVLDTVNSDFVTYLQNIADYGEQLEEIAEKEKEAFTGISFDEFKDGFTDMLSDLDATNKDFADNFEEYLQNAVFSSLVANQYKDRIQKLYDSWSGYAESGGILTPDEAKNLRKDYQDIINDMLSDRDKLMDDFGWSSSEKEQQSASKGGFDTMTQDQATELSGRFTAVAESNYRIEDAANRQAVAITELSGTILALNANMQGLHNIADETRSILANSYLELQQISENTGAIIIPIHKIQKDIEQVKQNTSRL